jgi:hypothetical protein
MGWQDIVNHHAPTERPAQPQPPESSDFEIECAYNTVGATKNERWAVTETLKERGITPTPELVFLWVNKLRCRERIGA